jgi:hypothetical protein
MFCGLYAAAADHVEHDGGMAPDRAWRAPAPLDRQDPAGVSTGMPRGPPSAAAPGLAGAQGQAHGRITLALVFSCVLSRTALPDQLGDDPQAPSRSVTAIGKGDALPAADRRGKCDFDVPRRGCADLADLAPGLRPRGPAPANARPRRERLGLGPRLCGGSDS